MALVTGARSGLGQAMAITLATAGADIVGLGSSSMPTTQHAIEDVGRRFHEIICDLSLPQDHDRTFAKCAANFSKVDILVNCAGIIRRANVVDHSAQDWDDVMAVNLRSLFLLSQSAAKHMQERQVQGRIINIASVLSFQGGIRVAAYAATKHGVAGLTRAMANELAPSGITVNAIAPGYMVTDNTSALRNDEERSRQILARIPAGRWGVPADLATAVLFCASSSSAYVTGIVLPVDGGWLAR